MRRLPLSTRLLAARATAVSCLTEFAAHVKVAAAAKDYRGCHALARCGRRCPTVFQVDSTARHLIVEQIVSLSMTADYGPLRALAGCGRRHAAR